MLQISNQKPVELSPLSQAPVVGDFDPRDNLKRTVIAPLFNPLKAGHPVTITDSNGTAVTEDDITDTVFNCCLESLDVASEDASKEFLSSTMLYFDKKNTLLVKDIFTIQSAQKAGLPYPSPTIVYSAGTDIIPISKQYLAGTADYDTLFASFSFYTRCDTLGWFFANSIEFDDFKTWFQSQIAPLQAGLSADCNQLCNDFMQLDLNRLTESLILRNDPAENNEDYSFARLLQNLLTEYAMQTTNGMMGVFPFSLSELIAPTTVVFVNLEKHAHATPAAIKNEWGLIQKALSMNIRMVSNNQLNKLTAVPRAIQKAAASAVAAAKRQQQLADAMKVKSFVFTPKAPSMHNVLYRVSRIIKKLGDVAKSHNPYKVTRTTFARPNRRDPDDWNKQGKMNKTNFKPDLHVYVDTSGSISLENYKDAIRACIEIAKKCNVSLYFNSFSHIMSQTTLLHTRDKTPNQIFKEFERVPKVGGGTDIEQIWHFINQSKKRTREFSLIITDFEWTARNSFVKHPKNLYYLPCSGTDWKWIQRSAESFCRSCLHNEPNIRKRLLF